MVAAMPARDAVFQLGGGPWYGYWHGVIPPVVEWRCLTRDSELLELTLWLVPMGRLEFRTH